MLGPTMANGRLPTIRELVATLAQRDGVDAVVLLGRDGMVIDGRAHGGADLDPLAAHVPPLVATAADLSATSGRGGLVTAVLEYERGYAVVTTLAADTMLLVLVHPMANLGALIADLRRHRGNIASII
ncbi:MAG: roadblock/LC7 domain-containing protein [Gemmatimonadaceae bacterium]|nr:roadblock/LC7 domain-containing protein [Gemmatimonadaceae bacterium]